MWPRLSRIAFWVYVPVLFGATHWPSLQIGGPVGTDKSIHIFAFGLWTALLIAAGLFGPPLSWRNILAACIIAPMYAAIDETTQAIPFLHRSAEFADWFANLKGIATACIGAIALAAVRAHRSTPDDAGPVSSTPP